jgi:hypothetical protein
MWHLKTHLDKDKTIDLKTSSQTINFQIFSQHLNTQYMYHYFGAVWQFRSKAR